VPTVIADAGPLHYLILIQQTDILRELFGSVVVPVVERPAPSLTPDRFAHLGSGEAGVLSLAARLQADLVLIDDRDARKAAQAGGLAVSGTIGVLDRAASRGLVDLRSAFDALRNTNFRIAPSILDRVLVDHGQSMSAVQGQRGDAP
jgi:predicted nucleic acid-binding protein